MGIRAAAWLLIVVLLPAGLAASQDQHRRKWWHDEAVKAEIGLTDEQSTEVEAVFQTAIPRLRSLKTQLDGLETELSRLIRERTADETVVAGQIDRVEATRGELSKARTLMLYRIHRILTPEQNARLQAIQARAKERGKDSRRPRS